MDSIDHLVTMKQKIITLTLIVSGSLLAIFGSIDRFAPMKIWMIVAGGTIAAIGYVKAKILIDKM